MSKQWYILIDGVEHGPFSIDELIKDRRLTKETLARKEGEKNWRAIKDIAELKFLFEEEVEIEEEEEEEIEKEGYIQEEIVLRYEPEPPIMIFLMILALSLALYILLRIWLP